MRDASTKATLEQKIAQKLILDFRFFENDDDSDACKQPLTKLPDALAELIRSSCLGGIILFKENLHNPEQIIELTNSLQYAAMGSALGLPLFLSVDHEGGRVTRLPDAVSTSFSGNMSIGAAFHEHDDEFAKLTGKALAKELSVLGINVNHAPVVDVNSDKNNPVINSRAFSDNPNTVAKLAIAQVEQMQQHGVMATLKHFPGHGNTSIDSHTGLPCIHYSKEVAEAIDLLPYKQALLKVQPAMIMTAHIQYPALDSTLIMTKNGEQITVPATMSRKILHDYLRSTLNYSGLIVTDALDMAGISDYFSDEQAVINCFSAGVDIAVMPIRIRRERDVDDLFTLISGIADAVRTGLINEEEISASFERIIRAKNTIKIPDPTQKQKQLNLAESILGCKQHREIEISLARKALTVIKGQALIGNCLDKNKQILIMMPQAVMGYALKSALLALDSQYKIDSIDLQNEAADVSKNKIDCADIIIAGHIYPKQSAVELGGIEDLDTINQSLHKRRNSTQHLIDLLKYAKPLKSTIVFASLRTPYDIENFEDMADIAFACYSYNVRNVNSVYEGATFSALASALHGNVVPSGRSPVMLK